MTAEEFTRIQEQFNQYVNGFAEAGKNLHPLLRLKADHCDRVAVEARALSEDLGWSLSGQYAAEALGFLHDVGRFSQFADFETFSDAVSVNHGERGWEVVRQEGWLSTWSVEERDVMLDGIRLHNGRTIPSGLSSRSLASVRLIRDADKLDIFGIVLDAVERDGFQDLPKMLPHISLDRTPTSKFIQEIRVRKSASIQQAKSVADFLLLQLSWAFDLNYAPTVRRFHDRGICERILGQMEADVQVGAFKEDVEAHVRMRMETGTQSCERS